MAIQLEGSTTGYEVFAGGFGGRPDATATVPFPAASPGDIIHLFSRAVRFRFSSTTGRLLVVEPASVTGGWTVGPNGSYYRIVTGDEDPTFNINAGLPNGVYRLFVTWALAVHSGVNQDNPHHSEPAEDEGARALVHRLQAGMLRIIESWPDEIDPYPTWPTPAPSIEGTDNPPAWPVRSQLATPVIDVPQYDDVLYARGSAALALFDTDLIDATEVLDLPAAVPYSLPNPAFQSETHSEVQLLLLRDAADEPDLDAAPSSGQIPVTGSGALVPEWVSQARGITTPLRTNLGTPASNELVFSLEVTGQGPVALDAVFNSIGACTSATAVFPEPPGLKPFEHALQFTLRRPGEAEEAWWAGVVKDIRPEGGLWLVDLVGFWDLANENLVERDPLTNAVIRPTHPVLEGALWLSEGRSIVGTSPRTWSQHYRSVFRDQANASWGVGPDRVFVAGVPEAAGYVELDALHAAVLRVGVDGYVFPPYVTRWWAETDSGVQEGSVERGLLTPIRAVQGSLNEVGQLERPDGADASVAEGPSHTIEYAGIAIPPILAVNIPEVGSQMVASARVQVTVGEEGSMPRVTTTLTTVALPFRRPD